MTTTVVPADLDFTTPVFPNNVVDLVAMRFEIFTNLNVIRRSLRTSDPNLSVGIAAASWLPIPGSQEMRGIGGGSNASTLEQYVLTVEGFVRDDDEERGLATHSVLSEAIRTTLGDDAPLRAQLGGLQSVFGTTQKSLQRFWVRSGRFASGKLQGAFLYLTTSEFVIEVEKI